MASTGLSKTFSSGNRKTWTWSGWIKRGSGLGGDHALFSTGTYPDLFQFIFNAPDDCLRALNYESGTDNLDIYTNARYRDVNGWYHIVLAVDTTQATSSDRAKLYVNGDEVTSLQASTYPSQNTDLKINLAQAHSVGYRVGHSDQYFDGSMTHIHFIDGTQYQASDFGETDATTGIWKPKTAPSVTYGTNGFFLKFENSGAFGTDSSGNSNNFTVNGTMTQTIDTPNNVFATLNPLDNYYNSSTFTNGNNTVQTGTSQYTYNTSTLGVSSGKWYCEIEYDATTSADNALIGITSEFSTASTEELGDNSNDWGYYATGEYRNNNSWSSYGNTYTVGDIIGIALDLDNNKLYFSKNGTWQNSGDPTSGATGTGAISITDPASTNIGSYFIAICHFDASSNGTYKTNFGNGFFGTTAVSSAQNPDDGIGIFEYDVPTGYRALCTKSINAEEYS